MTTEDIVHRIREACDGIYEKYEGHPLIEREDLLDPFEDIIQDYYEEKSFY